MSEVFKDFYKIEVVAGTPIDDGRVLVAHFKIWKLYNGGTEPELWSSGGIKWDGCMNRTFLEEESNVADHTCGLRGVEDEHAVWLRVYDLARDLMPGAADF